MPMYEYWCSECDNVFEEQQLIANRDLPTIRPCSCCGGYTINREVGNGGGFRLKGSCWSRDNYSSYYNGGE